MVKIETLYDLFPEQGEDKINKLLSDQEFQDRLPSLVLERLNTFYGDIIPIENGITPLFFSRADFAEVEEAYKIANLFTRYFSYDKRFLPLAVDFLEEVEELRFKNQLSQRRYAPFGQDFASRCLFSLSFFYQALEKLYTRHGAPHPEFYREMGKRTFSSIGEESIADNFEKWEDFIREEAFS